MKTDRELLELAAKASGYEFDSAALCGGPELALDGMRIIGLRLADGSVWSPLTDDGDALRLMTALLMSMTLDSDASTLTVFWSQLENSVTQDYSELGLIPSLRRAIVRAAAAIGEAMQ